MHDFHKCYNALCFGQQFSEYDYYKNIFGKIWFFMFFNIFLSCSLPSHRSYSSYFCSSILFILNSFYFKVKKIYISVLQFTTGLNFKLSSEWSDFQRCVSLKSSTISILYLKNVSPLLSKYSATL